MIKEIEDFEKFMKSIDGKSRLTADELEAFDMLSLKVYNSTKNYQEYKDEQLKKRKEKDDPDKSKDKKKEDYLKDSERVRLEGTAEIQNSIQQMREKMFKGEERILIPSPKVATYDLKPEMSAFEVTDKLVEAIKSRRFDAIIVNFANGDMVGHTGVYNAIAKAVWAVDNCVREVIEAAKKNDYEAIIIADHGNADNAVNPDGTPNTAHSLNPVPFIYVTDNNSATVREGRLADVAPSILHIMGLEQPKDMTGENLIMD